MYVPNDDSSILGAFGEKIEHGYDKGAESIGLLKCFL